MGTYGMWNELMRKKKSSPTTARSSRSSESCKTFEICTKTCGRFQSKQKFKWPLIAVHSSIKVKLLMYTCFSQPLIKLPPYLRRKAGLKNGMRYLHPRPVFFTLSQIIEDVVEFSVQCKKLEFKEYPLRCLKEDEMMVFELMKQSLLQIITLKGSPKSSELELLVSKITNDYKTSIVAEKRAMISSIETFRSLDEKKPLQFVEKNNNCIRTKEI